MTENLVGNAVKYGTPNTAITVRLRNESGAVEIEIHNHGNPISEKEQAFLFKSFDKSPSSENCSTPGWGVGFTLVKGVVAAHSGSVKVKSDEGFGTSFIVALPYVAAQAKSASGDSP